MQPDRARPEVSGLSSVTTAAEFAVVRDADRHRYWSFNRALREDDDEYSAANPAFRLASEYFGYYLDGRPSDTATQALAFAFEMWDHLKGVSAQVHQACTAIDPEGLLGDLTDVQETWRKVAVGVRRSYGRDDRLREGLDLLEHLAAEAAPPMAVAAMLREAAPWREREGQPEVARKEWERILQLDTSHCAWYVEYQARGHLYGYDNLHIGQPAPGFALCDIDGNLVDLADHRGKVVLLDFWSTSCPFCLPEFPYLKESRRKFSQDRYSVIGVSLNQDTEKLREYAAQHALSWPHICCGRDWDEPLALLFNITGIPNSYIFNADGVIAAKDQRGQDLIQVLDSILAQ